MINLLPDDRKRDVLAARMNVVLLRYNFLVLIALGVLITLCLLFYVILQTSENNAVTTSSDNNQKAASFGDVKSAADEYRNNLSVASKILDNGVNYTSVVFAITKLLPDGVILDGINISAENFGQQTSFSAHAKTYAAATQLKNNFEKSSNFTNVYFQNLTDNTVTAGAQGTQGVQGVQTNTQNPAGEYSIAVTISAKLAKEFK